MKIGIDISILSSEANKSLYIDIINYLSFENPFDFFFNGKTYRWKISKIRDLIDESGDNFTFILQKRDDFDSIVVSSSNTDVPYRVIRVTCDLEKWFVYKNQIELAFIKLNESFLCCCIYNHSFYLKQNATYETDLSLYGFHDELKNVSFITNGYGEKIIDKSKNIGILQIFKNGYIVVSPIMYFGDSFFVKNNKKIFLNYKEGLIVDVSNHIFCLNLFSNIENTEQETNYLCLKKFYEFLRCNQ